MNASLHCPHASIRRLAFLHALAFCALGCNYSRQPGRALREDRRELARQLENAVEGAGRSQVWIKSAGHSSLKPETAIEARAGSEVYSAVVAALRSEAKKNHLECAVNESRGAAGWRVADLRLSRSGKLVWRWKLHEVRRILHAAIIIDDLGASIEKGHELLALPYPLTFSVLPHLSASAETARAARRAGREVMLHLPMEPEASSHAARGEGEIRIGMSRFEVERLIDSDLASVPGAAGVNNHMGSRATADPRLMAAVMKSLAGRHLYFVDSRTTAVSVAFEAARRQGLPVFYRSVFLDDIESTSYTREQLRRFRQVLEEQGAALAIGHPYPTTIAALTKFLPEFVGEDVRLTPASELLQLPEVANLKPPPARR